MRSIVELKKLIKFIRDKNCFCHSGYYSEREAAEDYYLEFTEEEALFCIEATEIKLPKDFKNNFKQKWNYDYESVQGKLLDEDEVVYLSEWYLLPEEYNWLYGMGEKIKEISKGFNTYELVSCKASRKAVEVNKLLDSVD